VELTASLREGDLIGYRRCKSLRWPPKLYLFSVAKFIVGPRLVGVAQELLRLGLTSLTRKTRKPRVGCKDGYCFTTIASRYREAKGKNGSMSLELAMQLGRFKEAKDPDEHDRVHCASWTPGFLNYC
jgi:hypothetical protein